MSDDANTQDPATTEEESSTQTTSATEPTEIEKLALELEQMTELAKRTMADLQNMRRRQEEERSQLYAMANFNLTRDLLPILDNLERAIQHLPQTGEEAYKGLEMSVNQFHKVMMENGLSPIESLGQPFNPDFHEALAQGPGPKDIVTEELERGYLLGNRVIRHAKVKVGNGETTSEIPPENS